MSSGHDHGERTAAHEHRGRLAIVLGLMLFIAVVQVIGSGFSSSLALLADAGHSLADSAGVALALFAVWLGSRPFSTKRTFGLQRAEILAAAANALILFALCAFVVYEAVKRVMSPEPVTGPIMVAVATFGLVGNLIGMMLLRKGKDKSLNLRGAYLEVFSDMLTSLGVIIAAVVIWTTGWHQADSVASLLIAAIIVPRAWRLLSEAVHVLLEATPRNVDLEVVRDHMLSQPGVVDIHDLHAWTITSGVPVMSAHVVVREEVLADCGKILDDLHACLSGHFDMAHSTLQIEPEGHVDHEGARHT
ncbi:cation transporter [Spiractinospora alimapuensis]|uniref:cation diffusion facilitator family transporter n=1 Tax=Spiractinospora alimapuensis TaxID=2820884 RepID=UPI001F224DCB|nr:cation diffusion facilitator family transporter [Spiractinospora alimapuensis]QVQ51707.1 cation transporter [Spiractinospora alimapuensis]